MFFAAGAVFLLFDGAASLLGAAPQTALDAENTVTRNGDHIPDTALLAALAVLVALLAWWRLTHKRTPLHDEDAAPLARDEPQHQRRDAADL